LDDFEIDLGRVRASRALLGKLEVARRDLQLEQRTHGGLDREMVGTNTIVSPDSSTRRAMRASLSKGAMRAKQGSRIGSRQDL